MDILTHIFSGVAAGTAVSSFSRKGFGNKLAIISLAGFGGALPDFDVISLWSKFDGTIGALFRLKHTGQEIYSSRFWYSHHGFFHSLSAGILFTLIIGISIAYFTDISHSDG